ncbi:MAG TPA: TolC family protein [Ignavibacteriaceae bacterium]|nr:TolC family protein [Ignavibacteriaceae bacterium]
MRIIFTFLIAIFISTTSNSQSRMSLDDAIRIALQKNTSLKQIDNNISTFESSKRVALGNFLPTLSASGSWDWTRNENAASVMSIAGFNFDIPESITESRSFSLGANSNIVLFDGLSNYASLSQSENNLESAILLLERTKQEIVFRTISLYYSIVEIEQILNVRAEDVKQQQKTLETIEERNRLGAVTLADVYQQQVQLGNAELEVIRAQNNLESAKSNLLFFLGLDVLEEYEFSKDLSSEEKLRIKADVEEDIKVISELVTQALSYRKDFIGKQLDLESAYDGITIARSGHFPRLTGSAGFGSSANTFDNLLDSKRYSAGFTLSIPIFSGFRVSNQVQFAEVRAMNTELELKDLERKIKQDIQQSLLDLQAVKKALKVTEKNVIAAEENLKIEREKYALGAGKLLDVLIANTFYTNAQTNFINTQFNYVKLSEQLKYNLGVLDHTRYE